MPARVFITIDTEEDLWDKWKQKDNPVENISRIPLLQGLFDRFKSIPTYLVNYAVVANRDSCNIIKKLYDKQCCEIGSHIHPWNTPPLEENITANNTMICNLPYKLAYDKIRKLHNEIKDRIGYEPQCFRAGRWGFGPTVASCIYELGYKIDTSVTPFCDWTNENGPDFTGAPTLPYRFNPSDILAVKPYGRLLEIPPTMGFFQRDFDRCAKWRKQILRSQLSRYHLLGIFDRLRILNFRKLSPEGSSGSDMIRLAKTFIKNGCCHLNMSFHSSSLLPGKSPYVRNELDLQKFLSNIEAFLKFVKDSGMAFAPLSAVLNDLPPSHGGIV